MRHLRIPPRPQRFNFRTLNCGEALEIVDKALEIVGRWRIREDSTNGRLAHVRDTLKIETMKSLCA